MPATHSLDIIQRYALPRILLNNKHTIPEENINKNYSYSVSSLNILNLLSSGPKQQHNSWSRSSYGTFILGVIIESIAVTLAYPNRSTQSLIRIFLRTIHSSTSASSTLTRFTACDLEAHNTWREFCYEPLILDIVLVYNALTNSFSQRTVG